MVWKERSQVFLISIEIWTVVALGCGGIDWKGFRTTFWSDGNMKITGIYWNSLNWEFKVCAWHWYKFYLNYKQIWQQNDWLTTQMSWCSVFVVCFLFGEVVEILPIISMFLKENYFFNFSRKKTNDRLTFCHIEYVS